MEYLEQYQKHILGIDTSNYKTSLALISQDDIICDIRKFLDVKQGERGLRQSEALFQHVKNLPLLFDDLNGQYAEIADEFDGWELREYIGAIAFSSRPRPVEGSYMPCFLAGASFARSLGAVLDVPVIGFSHQEGHIEAIKAFTEMSYIDQFIACHFSGGTCEVLKVGPVVGDQSYEQQRLAMGEHFTVINGENSIYEIEQIGGTKDISFGQVLDRAGVQLGMSFPCGADLDRIAMETTHRSSILTPIKVNNCEFNLSGIDTQIKNHLDDADQAGLVREIFEKFSDAIIKLLLQACQKTGYRDVIMSGGVSTSRFIRKAISDALEEEGVIVYFDDLDLSSDNAVGTALLGGKYIWP